MGEKMKIPEPSNTIEALIYAAYEQEQEDPRPHMGASELGHHCDRWLWLKFRHAVIEQHDGRMLLLFQRGHEEEKRVYAHLRRIGVQVSKGKAFAFGSHVAGTCDGFVECLPHAPKAKAILEIKTHSEKSFNDLKAKGVQEAKPMHWIQCCVYGLAAKMDRALYFAVNKNTDEIYTEWLHLDKDIARKYIERGQRIALADRMPEPASADPSWYQCKWCPAYGVVCHQGIVPPSKKARPSCVTAQDWHHFIHVSCRTCCHSTAKADSTWFCEMHQDTIPVNFHACNHHVIHPDLMLFPMAGQCGEWSAFYEVYGHKVIVGGETGEYTSKELLANPSACTDKVVSDVRDVFGGRITR